MNAVDYLRAKNKMIGDCLDESACEKCPFHKHNNKSNVDCVTLELCHPNRAVNIVSNWAKANNFPLSSENSISACSPEAATSKGQSTTEAELDSTTGTENTITKSEIKDILRKQLQLLAEDSKNCPASISQNSIAMERLVNVILGCGFV